MRIRAMHLTLAAAAAALALLAAPQLPLGRSPQAAQAATEPVYHSADDVAWSPDGKRLAVSDRTAGAVVIMDPATGAVVRRVAVTTPAGIAWSGASIWVAENAAGRLAQIDAARGAVVRRTAVGAGPETVAVCAAKGIVLTANCHSRDVSVVSMATGTQTARIATGGRPFGVDVSRDGSTAVAGYLTAAGDARDPQNAASACIIDLRSGKVAKTIRLVAGSTNLRHIRISKDGKWAYIAHTLGRFNLPTTQLDRGWVNTNAFTILDLQKRSLYVALLLDHPMEGAADPWGIGLSPDGSTAFVSLSGARQIARLELAKLHKYTAGDIPADSPLIKVSEEWAVTARNLWADIKKDPKQRAELANDLSALYVAEALERKEYPGDGPHGVAVSPDGKSVAVATYFAGTVGLLDPATGACRKTLSLGKQPVETAARRGERYFSDGTLCFQHWLSCLTCHPESRADGLNWDLLNDGIGNPKNTRSLVNSYRMHPLMWHGVRESMEMASKAGFRAILFREPEKGEVESVQAYLRSLRPLPSPYLVGGKLSAAAQKGKALFNSPRTRCGSCHTGPLLTDQKRYDVGTRGELDQDGLFSSPKLFELWRTAPFMHDGRATNLRQVLTVFNKGDKHGLTSNLSKAEITALEAYLLSL